MSQVPSTPPEAGAASAAEPRSRLLDAAVQVIRTKGYAATTVDDVCAAAGVTKGSFFHHFKSKEAMALAAVEHWNRVTGGLFAQAPHQQLSDPRDRVLAYLDLRKALIRGAPPEFTCLLGTMVQETFETWPRLRQACDAGIHGHAQTVARDLALAKALYAPDAPWDPEAVALFTQATLQGAFILAKAQGSADVVFPCIDHLRQHVAHLLGADDAPASTLKETPPMSYVDGFVTPVPTAKRDEYRQHAADVAVLFRQAGATAVVECWGDDVPPGKLTSFPLAVQCRDDETVVFSWVSWPSREVRDAGWKAVMADPHMADAERTIPFDGRRLIYGGFEVLLQA